MPVLRSEPDNTLAETLGNLGNSLTQSFNPLNQMRAQNMVSEMQQRAWELQKAKNIDEANREAADSYERGNPYGEDPASLAVSAAKIRNGQGDLSGSITAMKSLNDYRANQAAAKLVAAQHPDWDQATIGSAVAAIGSGKTDLPSFEKEVSEGKLTSFKTNKTIDASTAAENEAAATPNTTPASAKLTGLETLSDADKANQMLAGGRLRGTTGVLTPDEVDKANADRTIMGQAPLPIGTAPTREMQPQYDAEAAARAGQGQADGGRRRRHPARASLRPATTSRSGSRGRRRTPSPASTRQTRLDAIVGERSCSPMRPAPRRHPRLSSPKRGRTALSSSARPRPKPTRTRQ